MNNQVSYDVVVVGAGHNGLIAACYLAQAGLRVLVLEKNHSIGGATSSKAVFPGVDARLSVYSYLISLLPEKILRDLAIQLELRSRAIASYTPVTMKGKTTGLLISNVSEDVTRQSFHALTGSESEYKGYRKLQELQELFARKVWPTFLSPLRSRDEMKAMFRTRDEQEAWEYMVEKPLSSLIEDHLSNDTVRGAIFTDAKIGVSTYPEDPTLLQNRTFLYHVVGQGTGEWRVPVGGMGDFVAKLASKAKSSGVVVINLAEVTGINHSVQTSEVIFMEDGQSRSVKTRFVLFAASSDILNKFLPGAYAEEQVEGSVFKVNMVLRRLPIVKDRQVSSRDAFTGTLHLFEGYEQLKEAYRKARSGVVDDHLPGEVYCHSLTDPSILSQNLQNNGYQTLTLFGLDVPYQWFNQDNTGMRDKVLKNYLRSINCFLDEDFEECLAMDANNALCVEAKSPLDLENEVSLPKGNIFHGNLSWPFAENEDETGTWGVETRYKNVYLCGSSARRGGAVSGIPGHNAAMKVLEVQSSARLAK